MLHRSFKHYPKLDGSGGTWYHLLFNDQKFQYLYNPQNPYMRNLHEFIKRVIEEDDFVPNDKFVQGKPRSSAEHRIEQIPKIEAPSRYKKIIEEALEDKAYIEKNGGKIERHYIVQKYLLESPETNFIVSEVPVWSPNYEMTGHIDLIEVSSKNPYIWVHDYKPHSSSTDSIDPSGQLMTYQIMLAQLLNIPFDKIGLMWFDNIQETSIW